MQKTLSDDEHIYSKDNIFAVVKAAKELTDRAFKVYVRLNLNKNGFVSPLSPAWLKKEIGINSDKCRRAINELIEKGYLKRSDKQSNYYTFFELPTADLQVHTADLQVHTADLQVHTADLQVHTADLLQKITKIII